MVSFLESDSQIRKIFKYYFILEDKDKIKNLHKSAREILKEYFNFMIDDSKEKEYKNGILDFLFYYNLLRFYELNKLNKCTKDKNKKIERLINGTWNNGLDELSSESKDTPKLKISFSKNKKGRIDAPVLLGSLLFSMFKFEMFKMVVDFFVDRYDKDAIITLTNYLILLGKGKPIEKNKNYQKELCYLNWILNFWSLSVDENSNKVISLLSEKEINEIKFMEGKKVNKIRAMSYLNAQDVALLDVTTKSYELSQLSAFEDYSNTCKNMYTLMEKLMKRLLLNESAKGFNKEIVSNDISGGKSKSMFNNYTLGKMHRMLSYCHDIDVNSLTNQDTKNFVNNVKDKIWTENAFEFLLLLTETKNVDKYRNRFSHGVQGATKKEADECIELFDIFTSIFVSVILNPNKSITPGFIIPPYIR